MHIRLNHILFLGFTLISMVPVILLAWWMQQSALDKEIKAVKEKHLLVARNLTGALNRYVTDVEAGFELATKALGPDHQGSGIEGLLKGVYLKHVFLIDASGRIIKTTSMKVGDMTNLALDRVLAELAPVFKQAQARPGKIVYSDLMRGIEGKPSIFLVRSLDSDHFFVGAMGTEYIVEVQRSVAFGNRGHATIIDRRGRTIAHPVTEWRDTMKDISFLPPVQKMMLGQTGVMQFYSPAMQADMIAGYTTVKKVGWGVMIPQPFGELVEKAEGVVKVAFSIALLGVIVAGLISWWLASYLVRPIDAVVVSARAASQGRLSFELPRMGRIVPQELRQLVNSFNHMVQQINAKNREVEKSAARLAEAQRIARLGNWEWNSATDQLWCSEEVSRIFGQAPEKFSSDRATALDMVHPDDREAVKKTMDETLASGRRAAIDHRIVMADGSEKIVHLEMIAQRNDNGGGAWLVGTTHDITAAKEYEERLIYQANYDELTGLPNRTLFLDRLSQALLVARRTSDRVGLLFIDIDNFKEVNDTLGHTNGDKLLIQASRRLRECVRGADTVARLSGDEFTVILENSLHDKDVAVVAEKIVNAMARPFKIDTYEVLVGASIGISLYPNDGDDTATMLGNADIAMFRAKDRGRNSFCFFTSGMNDQMMHNMKLGNDLHYALNRNEFSVHYQPIVDVAANRIVAAEALVRWKHPKRGWIPPSEFISLAEERGFIGPLGEWVLETACREAVRWREELPAAPRLSVNLSIRQPKLGLDRDRIGALLQKSGMDPRQLTFEITESLVMEDSAEAMAWLDSVRSLGIRFSIDDFGTGYSSLSYLKRLPVNTLKIDQSFLTDLSDGSGNASLVESIIALAASFGLGVVAEGVEERRQVDFLHRRGCYLLQGYYFSRPLPPDEFLALLKDWRGGIPEALTRMEGGRK